MIYKFHVNDPCTRLRILPRPKLTQPCPSVCMSVWTLWSRKLCNRQYLSIDLDNKKCQGATKTTSLKHVEVKASVPNPNLISNISSQLLISEISISWLTFLAHKKTRSPWDFLPSGVCGPQLDSRVTCQLPSRFTRGENFKRIAYKIHCSLNEQNSLVQCLNDLQISCKWPLHPTENFTSAKVNPAMSVSLYVRMNAVISKTM